MDAQDDLRPIVWHDPFAPREGAFQRVVRFSLVAGAHVLLIAIGLHFAAQPEARQAARELLVRLIELPQPAPQVKEATPPPPKPEPVKRPLPPPPVLTAAAETPTPTNFVVATQPPAPPRVEPVSAPPAPPAVSAARFDADYLNNPKPVYPTFSRRQGEEGKVLLRVHVSSAGTALEVALKDSSGYPRLDAAARDAVQAWRFVPARRGDEPIESWVVVPIVFKLDS